MLKKVALAVGILFFALGLLCFTPGISSYDNNNVQLLFGVFSVTLSYAITLLVIGVGGLVVALSTHWSKVYLIATGALCTLAALVGFFSPTLFGLTRVNMADNWVNTVLAVLILGMAFGIHPDFNPSIKKSTSSKTA